MGYVGLHHHTTYSFLEAIGVVKKHIGRVAELGMTAIAITDYNSMYGAMDLYTYAKDADIKPIIGVDLPWVRDLSVGEPRHWGNITLLARSVEGYHTLLRLVSAAYMRRDPGQLLFLDLSLLREDHSDLLAFWGGVDSRYGQALLRGETPSSIQDQARLIIDTMGAEHVFAEIIAQDYQLLPDTRRINDHLLQDAELLGIKPFVSNNVHYVRADDAEAFEVARAIKDNKKIYDEDRRKTIGEYHIVDGARIMQMMQRNGYDEVIINQWIDQTATIADSIDITLDMGETLFPNYEVGDEMRALYEQEKGKLVVE